MVVLGELARRNHRRRHTDLEAGRIGLGEEGRRGAAGADRSRRPVEGKVVRREDRSCLAGEAGSSLGCSLDSWVVVDLGCSPVEVEGSLLLVVAGRASLYNIFLLGGCCLIVTYMP